MYKRQQSPSWWLPSGPVIPNVTVEHGPGGLCPTQAVSGPHGAPRAASHRRPRDRERGRDGPAWPPCKLRPTASASHVCHSCWRPTRRQRGGREGAGRHHARSASPAEGRIGPTGRLVGSAQASAAARAAAFPTAAAERLRAGASEAVCVRKYQQVAWLAYDGSRSS